MQQQSFNFTDVTATEKQIRKAKQLFYARSIGFKITGKDYQRWHLL